MAPSLIFTIVLLAQTSRETRLVDMVVAQVESTVITLSELIAEARLALLADAGAKFEREAVIDQALLDAVLRMMVSRELLLAEARRLQLQDVRDEEVLAELSKLRNHFEAKGDFGRFLERIGFSYSEADITPLGPAPPALLAILRANVQVQQFIAFRIRSEHASEQEIIRCYRANSRAVGLRPLQDVRPAIERSIESARRSGQLRGWIAKLHAKANVRYSPGFRQDFDKPEKEPPEEGLTIRCPSE